MKGEIRKYLMLGYIFILSFLVILPPVVGSVGTKSITAVQDSTVDAYSPDINYGGQNNLEIGYFLDWLRAYIKFDLSEAPENFHKAELKLEVLYIEATTLLSVHETSTAWNEYSITWNNAPSLGALIVSGNIAEDIIYVIDVTNDVEGVTGYWSLCLSTTDSNWVYFVSRQCFTFYNPPRIIYHFTVSDVPFYIGLTVVLTSLAVIGTVSGLIYARYRRKRASRELPIQKTKSSPYKVVRETQISSTDVKFCIKCGKKNPKSGSFCIGCGQAFPDNF